MDYVARFQRSHAVLLILFGLAPLFWLLFLVMDERDHGGQFVVSLFLLVSMTPTLIIMAIIHVRRSRKSGGIALRVDEAGVYFGANGDSGPRFCPWDQVSAVVLFARRTFILQGMVRCVGLRLHPYSPESPERYLEKLYRALERQDLEDSERADVRRLIDKLAHGQLEMAVSWHVEARGWQYWADGLRSALTAHAPGVPVAVFSEGSHWDLVGWQLGREKLAEILETAELRKR
ncbi:hypothetical protein ACGFNU_13815 [Spirillospora sp. NPDC048911]|uniref:hypothetical protein n=1 Tax=Spirillospora sp. NPDC048911 TaxID=3364527 RepID=UPI00371FEDF2